MKTGRSPFQERDRNATPRPMGTPDQILNAYFHEVIRYRSAMFRQTERISEACAAWLAALGHPLSETVDRFDYVEKQTLSTEIEFFAVAVRGMLGMASAIGTLAARQGNVDLSGAVDSAVAAFWQEAPHTKLLRDLISHLDEYVRGEGKLFLPSPEIGVRATDDDVVVVISDVEISTTEMASAADRLSGKLNDLHT